MKTVVTFWIRGILEKYFCQLSNASRVCITASNSLNPTRVYMRLCKHGKSALLVKQYKTLSKYYHLHLHQLSG